MILVEELFVELHSKNYLVARAFAWVCSVAFIDIMKLLFTVNLGMALVAGLCGSASWVAWYSKYSRREIGPFISGVLCFTPLYYVLTYNLWH